ncbi:MAG TPA: DUF1178 family protein [Sphingomonas sp.]|uniref:DUF1178 family protein n=1 Tax=Sphingomonas sp. TaxID=28214 RepID=UPI002C502E79|nr:DUF1178 family protein [Sphingomonas sp.]HMI20786.1 DUF1178 family protein [Sphingomonas sp.]
MIVFDLACGQRHVFEAWFGSTEDYESQRARGLVACPICGATEIGKAVMAPNVAPKGNQGNGIVPMQSGTPTEMKKMLAALAKAQAQLLEKSEHVGAKFASEARAIHEGDAPERAIHGQATHEEARALVEDGVPVAPLPLPVVPPDTTH